LGPIADSSEEGPKRRKPEPSKHQHVLSSGHIAEANDGSQTVKLVRLLQHTSKKATKLSIFQ